MATYFHGNSEIQAPDGLQTLVLINPGYIHYSNTPPPPPPHAGNLVFLNSAAIVADNHSGLTPQSLPHAPPTHTQQFVGIPLPAATSQDPNQQSMHAHPDVSALHGFLPRMQYNLWNPMDSHTEARETPRSQQGLSLSLFSQQAGFMSLRVNRDVPSQAQVAAMSGDDVKVSGVSSSLASEITNGVSGIQSMLLSSKYLKAAQVIT